MHHYHVLKRLRSEFLTPELDKRKEILTGLIFVWK